MNLKSFRYVILLLSTTLLLTACDLGADQASPTPIPGNQATINFTSTGTSLANPTQGSHVLFVEPDDGVAPVLSTINEAKSSLELKMYLLSEREVIAALQTARQRGVKIRVMLEEHPYGNGAGNNEVYKNLQNAGIEVKWTNPVFKLTHEKSLVVDNRTALIMTLNLTHSAFTKNREYGLLTSQPTEVQAVLAGFNADWDRTAFSPNDFSPLIWSNANSRQKILAFIDHSQKSLLLEQEEMQDNEVQQHLVDASRRGVKVRVLVASSGGSETTGGDYNQPGEQQLRDGGVMVKTTAALYMHAKIYLADNDQVIICSENVSTSSLNNNRELGISVSDKEIIRRIAQTFEKDWNNGTNI